tara:strand:+ start:260 stop:565 length:306 start_codon:yes stop_codon:yes gene_type:complete
MKRIKIGSRLLQIGLLIYLIENFYFGWNKLPMSDMELYADNTVRVLMTIGFIFYAMPIWGLYEDAVKKRSEQLKCDCKRATFTRTVDEDYNPTCGKCNKTL